MHQSVNNSIECDDTEGEFIVAMNIDNQQGAKLCLRGYNYAEYNSSNELTRDNAGSFLLIGNNQSSNSLLAGYPDGKLWWNGGNQRRFYMKYNSNGNGYSHGIYFTNIDGNAVGGFVRYAEETIGQINLECKNKDASQSGVVLLRVGNTGVVEFVPSTSGSITLGSSGRKWGQIYSTSSTINTSDARLKTTPESIPDNVLDAWDDINWVQYKMLDSVELKGAESARLHSGLIAQSIDESFKSHNLDASKYGFFCYDKWDGEEAHLDDNGNIAQEALPAGDQYSLRYEEALCMEAAYQRRENRRLKEKVASLEERLANLESRLNIS